MRAYELFREWRGRRIIGENLGDALKRNGLREPDEFAMEDTGMHRGPVKVKDGEYLPIKTVLVAERKNPGHRRGSDEFVTAMLELENGRIVEVDALLKEEIALDQSAEVQGQ